MPAFNAPLPRGSFPNYHESSPLRDKRDSDATGKQWKKSDNLRWQLSQIINNASQTNRQVQQLGRRILGMATQNITTPEFYPFKIYKPDLTQILNFGTTFDDAGNPIQIAINYNVPTNLPTTINPSTDGWRIWAIREGLVSSRSNSNAGSGTFSQAILLAVDRDNNIFQTVGPDFATVCEPKQADNDNGIVIGLDQVGTSTNEYGTPFDFNPQNGMGVPPQTIPFGVVPLIIPGGADSQGLYSLAIWMQLIFNETSGSPAGATLKAVRYETDVNEAPFPEITDSTIIPIGLITSAGINFYLAGNDPTALTAYNIQKGDYIGKYGSWTNNTIQAPSPAGLYLSGTLNYRGDFLNDSNLAGNLFYPGDVVKIESQITISSSSAITVTDSEGNVNHSGIIYSQDEWMQTVVGFTTDPTTDPNWVKKSGLYAASQTSPTPNTT